MGTFFSPFKDNRPLGTIFLASLNDNIENVNLKPKPLIALFDTGATSSCISVKIAEQLRLNIIDKATSHSVSGLFESYVYSGRITFPLEVTQAIGPGGNIIQIPQEIIHKEWKFVGAELERQGIDVLIGMDIISQGNFYINKTMFLFEMPTPIIQEVRVAVPPLLEPDKLMNHNDTNFSEGKKES